MLNLAALATAGALAVFASGCTDTDKKPLNTSTAPSVTMFNEYCPIMGGPGDPNLTRQFEGKTVAFCCPGCPEAWDKLTVVQKEQALASAKPNPEHIRLVHEATKTRGAHY
jgi:hypothetical protein